VGWKVLWPTSSQVAVFVTIYHNLSGHVTLLVQTCASQVVRKQAARHIEEARALKPGIIQLANRIPKFYVPAVLLLAGASILFHHSQLVFYEMPWVAVRFPLPWPG